MNAPATITRLWLALVVLVAIGSGARAGGRYAIVIGSNEGEPDEPELRFAERDAQRMTEVLTRLGDVRAEDVLTLLTPSVEQVSRALAAFRARVGAQGKDAMVIVYYSGHADERALHLSGGRYRFEALKAEVRAIGAELSIFLIDACRSGGIVRVKGAIPSEPFAFDVRDELAAEGLAIITSSAETEDAQESDRLEGGVFTHHLVTGLLGAADRSGDGRVTLTEVYRYAYTQTINSTSTTSIVQHPSYSFQVQGHDEIVMTELEHHAGRGRLRFESPGQYLVFDRASGNDLVAELEAEKGTSLWLKPGTYLVRRREQSAVYERPLTITADLTTTVGGDTLQRVPFRHAVRKGYGQDAPSLSLGLAFDLTAPILERTGPVLGVALGLQVDFADLAIQGRVRFGVAERANERVAITTRVLGVDAGVFHLFDIDEHGVGFGVRGGLDWLSQRFETLGDAPATDQLTARVGPFVRLELALGGAFTLTWDVGGEVYFLRIGRYGDGDNGLRANAILTSNLGVSGVLP